MSKILFPSAEPNLDFAANNNENGWVEALSRFDLNSIAEQIVKPDNVMLVDHAIPSPVAHIKDFRKRLSDGDRSTKNEWRGLIAAVALRKYYNLQITVRSIDIGGNLSTNLGKVFFDSLVSEQSITGYTSADTTFRYLCIDGRPFAMLMPSMEICPFKTYDNTFFNNLPWFVNGEWMNVCDVLSGTGVYSIQGKKLCSWLHALNSTCHHINDFCTELALANNIDIDYDTRIFSNYVPGTEQALSNCKLIDRYCASPLDFNAFSDKLLVLVPPSGYNPDEQGRGFPCIQESADNTHFTPRLTAGEETYFYVIPPISTKLVDGIKNDKFVCESWNTEYDKTTNKFVVSIKLSAEGNESVSIKNTYEDDDVVWTTSLPYISLWPFVDFSRTQSWNEYFIAMWKADDEFNTSEYEFKENGGRVLYKLTSRNASDKYVDVSVVTKSGNTPDKYSCQSSFIDKIYDMDNGGTSGDSEFVMHVCDSMPFALVFKNDTAAETLNGNDSFGAWIIDTTRAKKAVNLGENSTHPFNVGLDFGTTSTNVYIKHDSPTGESRSIYAPGKYLHTLYNPYNVDGNANMRNLIEKYFFFSTDNGSLGKFFTYGQNFTVHDQYSSLVTSTKSNVSGRSLVVDSKFITQGDFDRTGIYGGLKLTEEQDMNKKIAARNFIDNVLTYAVLDARAEGATEISLRLSIPDDNFCDVVTKNIGITVKNLKKKSNIEISCASTTEARAAGEYLMNVNQNAITQADGRDGFIIIDIGGGTTDISFWKNNDNDKLAMWAEHSFGYAGIYLVRNTIMKTVPKESFNNFWQFGNSETDRKVREELINSYAKVGSSNLPGAVVDFLLEKYGVRTDGLDIDMYRKFSVAMRMKYLALFYLVASNIKHRLANGEFSFSESIRLYLAGCGSKGIDLCDSHFDGMSFISILPDVFKKVLGTYAENIDAFDIVTPMTKDKQEVVVGLTHMKNAELKIIKQEASDDDIGDSDNVASEEKHDKEPENLRDNVREVYKDMLNVIYEFDPSNKDIIKLVDIGVADSSASKMYSSTFSAVSRRFEKRFQKDEYTYKEGLALLMLDELIEQFF